MEQFGFVGTRKMTERDRRKKFVELAEKRVSRTLRDIRLIGNLSNTSNYSYSRSDVQKIHRALTSAIDEMKARFERKGHSSPESFKL